MKCTLMNKKMPVLELEINENNEFTAIYEVINIDFAPLSIYNAYYNKAGNMLKTINKWFSERGIPGYKKDIDRLLKRLKVDDAKELLNRAYGLSLSDQYWLCPLNSDITWDSINFFHNDFQDKEYLEASLGETFNKEVNLMSPNNTTDGMVSKAWIIEDGIRKLVKECYVNSKIDPINEWLATQICERLNIEHCSYQLDVMWDKVVCKCNDFCSDEEEIVYAIDIYNMKKKRNNVSDYEHYISILEEKGISDAKECMSDMYLVDYLMLNTDRHMKNYGIIRNVNTLEWVKVMPVFDTGNSLELDKNEDEINFKDGYYKLFANTNASFEKLIKYIDKDKYDLEVLNGLDILFREKLIEYNAILRLDEKLIDKYVKGFMYRINLLKVNLDKGK